MATGFALPGSFAERTCAAACARACRRRSSTSSLFFSHHSVDVLRFLTCNCRFVYVAGGPGFLCGMLMSWTRLRCFRRLEGVEKFVWHLEQLVGILVIQRLSISALGPDDIYNDENMNQSLFKASCSGASLLRRETKLWIIKHESIQEARRRRSDTVNVQENSTVIFWFTITETWNGTPKHKSSNMNQSLCDAKYQKM